MSTRTALTAALALLALTFAACRADTYEPCQLQSDCRSGLACSPAGTCVHFSELQDYMEDTEFRSPRPEFISEADLQEYLQEHGYVPGGGGGGGGGDTGRDGCEPPAGIFEASDGPCEPPSEVHTVSGLSIADEGHGLVGMAFIANLAIPDYIESGAIRIEVWIDGPFDRECEHVIAYAQTADDRLADCTVEGADTIELAFPGITEFTIVEPELDPLTLQLIGMVDKDEMLANVPGGDATVLQVIDNGVTEDVDTDGDSVPDMASIVLTMLFDDGE